MKEFLAIFVVTNNGQSPITKTERYEKVTFKKQKFNYRKHPSYISTGVFFAPVLYTLLCGEVSALCGGSELLAGAWGTGRKRVGWRSVDLWASGADCLLLGQ